MCSITVIVGIGRKQVIGCNTRLKLMSQRQAEVTREGRRKEVNTPDKSVLMDEFTFPMRKRESARMPQRILVIRTERTSARVEKIDGARWGQGRRGV